MLKISSYLFGKPDIYFRNEKKNVKVIIDVAKEIRERTDAIAMNTEILEKNGWTNEFNMYDIYYYPNFKVDEISKFNSKDHVIKYLEDLGIDLSVVDFEEN